jgi:hypothetical protein
MIRGSTFSQPQSLTKVFTQITMSMVARSVVDKERYSAMLGFILSQSRPNACRSAGAPQRWYFLIFLHEQGNSQMLPKLHSFSIIAFLVLATAACAPEASSTTNIPCLLFAGKVINKNTGEWVNNRLILLFLKNQEVARTTTKTGEFPISLPERAKPQVGSNGVEDGLFAVFAPNIYRLTISTLGVPSQELSLFEGRHHESRSFSTCPGHSSPLSLVSWIDPFYEGETKEYFIKSKNIRYIITVLPGDISQLPAEIQQPGSVRLLEGNRLVAIDPKAPKPTPQPAFSNNVTKFDRVVEDTKEFPPAVFPINNCGGAADIKQEVTQTYIHQIVDESKAKLGIEIPILNWIKIVAEIERHYGISDKEIATYATTLAVPAGQNIQYTVIRKQTWESGMAVVVSGGVEVSAPYRVLKSETFEVAKSEKKSCP